MKSKRLWIRLAAALVLAGCAVLLGSTVSLPGRDAGRGPTTIALKAPPFVGVASAQEGQRTGTSFLEQEAGFAAYTNVERTIYLVSIRPLFRTIERETSEYIIGSVPAPDYDENWDVHVYAHRDGWVVAYYLNHEPAVKITDWRHYNGAAALPTQLDHVLTIVLNQIGATPGNIGYYHFHYPNATNVMLIADFETGGDCWDSFQLQIPGIFTVYERAWLHAAYDVCPSPSSRYQLNGADLSSLGTCDDCWAVRYGELQLAQLVPERAHTISIYTPPDCQGGDFYGHTTGALSLVYQEASQ